MRNHAVTMLSVWFSYALRAKDECIRQALHIHNPILNGIHNQAHPGFQV